MSQDDRAAFALLLLPFLIIAASLAMAQMRRTHLPTLPAIALQAPASAPRIGTASPPLAVAPLPVAAAPVLPLSPSLAPPLVTPVPAPPAIAFPPPQPVIDAPPVVVQAAPAPTPPTTPASPAQSADGPAAPVELANLDIKPPLRPLLPLPPVFEISRPEPTPPTPGACHPSEAQLASFSSAGRLARFPRQARLTGVDAETFGRRIAASALAQTNDLVIYTARYQPMAYPMGDVMALHGACIDVIIRAYRSVGIDLQEEIQRGRTGRGDTNIEHRRTENVRRFLERNGAGLPVTAFPEDYKPGDIVTYHRPFSRVSTSHIAVVSDVLAATGRPMIVHNRGYGPQLEDALFVDRITGHYRYLGPPAAAIQQASGPASTPAAATAAAAAVVRASIPARQARVRQNPAASAE